MSDIPSCGACVFWRMGVPSDMMHPADERTSDYGVCEGVPPIAMPPDGGGMRFVQPTTHKSRACREYLGSGDDDDGGPGGGVPLSRILPFSKAA